jgi:hypothetical protein
MDTYTNGLEDVLVRAAKSLHQDRAAAIAARRRRSRAAAAIAAAAGCAAIAVSALGGDDQAGATLPALSDGGGTVSINGQLVPQAVQRGMDLREAHPFRSPKGTGYVLTSRDGKEICLALPDPPAGYGEECATTSDVQRRGLVGQLISPDREAGYSQVAVVLPADAQAPVVRYRDGREEVLGLERGVAAAQISGTGTLTFTVAGQARSIHVEPFEQEGKFYRDCGDGRIVEVPTRRDTAEDRRESVCDR